MTIKRLVVLVALLLAGLTLASQPASVSAQQDPQPPWQGTLTVATQRQVLVGEQMSLQIVASEAPLAPNGPGESIGVYGHNSQWVNISPFGHVVPSSSVVNITANPGFSQGWDSRGEANPLWQGITSRSCEVYLLDTPDGALRGSGMFVQTGSQVGVYAVLGNLLQVSPWLQFINNDCATGAFPKPAEPVITGGGYVNGTMPYTLPMTDSMLSGCDEPHEISGEHVQPDGTILVICRQAETHLPNGGEVALFSIGALVGFVSPVPGDGAAVVAAWIARAGKVGVVAVGVASTAVAVQQAAPALTTFDLPPFHPASSAATLYDMMSPGELQALLGSQGFVLCSGEVWSEVEDGLNITCPSTGGILMLKNPANLEDENPIPGLPAPPPHLQNHPRGEYTAKLKRLGWWKVVFAMHDYHTNGGKPPDWCGIREDGALFVVYYSVQVLTKVGGRVYQGFALLLHTNGVSESTVFPKVVPGQNGLPYTGNSGQEPAETFTPIDPRQCPPPPPMVVS
jgi:disulfide bond formation protein DsbB